MLSIARDRFLRGRGSQVFSSIGAMPPRRGAPRRQLAQRKATQVELMAQTAAGASGSAMIQNLATDIEVRGYGPASSLGAEPREMQLFLPAADNDDTDLATLSKHAMDRHLTPLICFRLLSACVEVVVHTQ